MRAPRSKQQVGRQKNRPAIPRGTLRALRAEVGFVCPVGDCDSPYLSFHHFDPPWNKGGIHRAEGMVALCLEHHKQADHGAFSAEQLRDFKRRTISRPAPAGRFEFRTEQLVLVGGGNLAVRTPTFLSVGGRPLVWLSSDERGNQLLNLEVRARDGSVAFSMRDNDWVVARAPSDMECPPSATALVVRAPTDGIFVELAFDRVTWEDVTKLLATRGAQMLAPEIRRAWNESEFVVAEFRAELPYEGISISRTSLLGAGAHIAGCVSVGCGALITIA